MSNVKIVLLGDARGALPYAPLGFYYAKRFRANGHTSMSRVIIVSGARIRVVLKPDGHDKVFVEAFGGRAIFGYGTPAFTYGSVLSMTNKVSNIGVVAADTTGVGTARMALAAAGYGGDKAIFGYGSTNDGEETPENGANYSVSITNLVSNTGVVATDTTGVGTRRYSLAAAGYGGNKAIFGYGRSNIVGLSFLTNKVSSTGVVATDTVGAEVKRSRLAAAGYGHDKAIFGFGNISLDSLLGVSNRINLVSNTGVVATETLGLGTERDLLAAAGYGGDKAIFGYGETIVGIGSMTNKVSNTGVVATDTTGVGTARWGLAAAGYGGDKAIFGYGARTSIFGGLEALSRTNLVSNTGVVAADTTGVGTARRALAAASFGSK